ncbi:MAG: 3',5'-nucleoside bisphosphate phosphatase [Burkholderiaceae bacterium]|nr:3',5'-nucleoside bisphosphate phosphatase [Burkholderiaceae bacterium]
MLNVDLHSHSTVSDGVLSPTALVARAKSNGVNVMALTDHDEVQGIAEARQAADVYGVRFVSGVEISTTWAGSTVHIVGLGVDETNQQLIDGLAQTRSGRVERAHEMSRLLEGVGICGAYEGAMKMVSNPFLVTRKHFARHLVGTGICRDIKDAFRQYLVEGKPGYMPHRWASLENAVKWIRDAGGVAGIAHPGRYRFSDLVFGAFFEEFKYLGGTMIEVVTGSHTVDQYRQYAKVAKDYGFQASIGSDFHAPGESRVDIGELPGLPEGLVPVWQDWF